MGTNKIQMPREFYEMTPEQIKALCESGPCQMFKTMPAWNSMTEQLQRFYRRKAWWTLKGAVDPGDAAAHHGAAELPVNEEWDAECRKYGWKVWHPQNYRDLENEFLPRPIPNINHIMARCPQMAMLLALGGNVSEPYWWAGLSITEHAAPNLSRECSDAYPNFSDVELEYRTTRIHREGTKPALCSRLDDVNSGVCLSCRFKGVVRSPIALGFDNEPRGGHHG